MKDPGRWVAATAIFVAMGGTSRLIAAHPAALSWDEAFPVSLAKSDLYLDAHYIGSDGVGHRLQLWRRGTSFLHRRTDDTLDLYLEKTDGQADYRYSLFDHRRRLALALGRRHLYRIGVFSDWYGLAHVLDRPKTRFTLRAAPALPDERTRDCTWRLLVRETPNGTHRSRICWSPSWGVPLVIRTLDRSGTWVDHFVADRLDDRTLISDGMAMPDTPDGYASFDVGKEIAPEAGD